MAELPRISETLVDFAHPALKQIPPDASLRITKLVMTLVVRVWNDRVMESAGGRTDVAETLRRDLDSTFTVEGVAAFLPLVETLSERKRLYFADDNRLVANWSIEAANVGWKLKAVAAPVARATDKPA